MTAALDRGLGLERSDSARSCTAWRQRVHLQRVASDPETGLLSIIAVHSTAPGPAVVANQGSMIIGEEEARVRGWTGSSAESIRPVKRSQEENVATTTRAPVPKDPEGLDHAA